MGARELAQSVVLPVYNQADHLESVVTSYVAALDARRNAKPGDGPARSYELILVPNGCRDESEAICAQLAADHPGVRVVPAMTPGWGSAVRVGLSAAGGDTLCYTNLARTTAADLVSILAAAQEHPNSVIKADRPLRESRRRRIGSALYNLEAAALFGIKVRDINGTPKAFPRRFSGLLELHSDGDLLDLEFVVTCDRNGYPLRSVPITSTARHGGASTTRMRSALQMYTGAWQLRTDRGRRHVD